MSSMNSDDDCIGKRFGRLIVIEKTDQKYRTCYLYRCKCDCGDEKLATRHSLNAGLVRSCGCLQKELFDSQALDVTGQTFGLLTAIEPTGRSENHQRVWRFQCSCGQIIEAPLRRVASGMKKSCGCLYKASRVKQAAAMREKQENIDGTSISVLTRRPLRNNTSGVTGVSWNSTHKLWQARIQFKGKAYHLGMRADFNEAVALRRDAEKRLHGEFLDWFYSKKAK